MMKDENKVKATEEVKKEVNEENGTNLTDKELENVNGGAEARTYDLTGGIGTDNNYTYPTIDFEL